MTYLICNMYFQIPFIEFMPGLLVKFTCCTKNVISHFDLDMHREYLAKKSKSYY